ncbi:MAG: ABC transporter permease [Thermoanaerobaculia bacterium]|nr:ABC transporter permease [Thermoanaerobaculia bacterium]
MNRLESLSGEIVRLTVEHITIVAIAVGVAIIIGIPLGIYCSRDNRIGRLLLRAIDAIQTVPSLAMFGFLIPIPLIGGIGTKTAIVALVLYSLLPIVRNTVVGIREVDRDVREAAVAMGMSPGQVLREVEIPLAMPTIIGGVRLALVIGIGVATIAAAIGGGGLGDFIFRGLAMVDSTLLLAGALPAALLALLTDLGLSRIERSIERRRGEKE